MKNRILVFLLLLAALPISIMASIPGKYEMIVPHVPPQTNSVDKVTLVEVFAFDCIHCYNFNRDTLVKLEAKFGDKLIVDPKPIGWRGHDPGRLYYIAKQENKEHDVMMMVFDLVFNKGLGKQMFQRDKLQFVAKKFGLTSKFKSMMDSPDIVRQMNESVQYAQQKNVNSTPTIIIEDVLIPERSFDNLVKIINALLKQPVP